MISIIMITYNRGLYIRKAIESVLKQSYKDWELIIIDDCSTDDTAEIIKSINDERIKYFRNEINLGISKSRNRALSLCKGEFVAVLDSDDFWIQNEKLVKQFDFLKSNKNCAVVGTSAVVFDENEQKIRELIVPLGDEKIRKSILIKNPFVHSSVLMVRHVVLECGGYFETMEVGEDYKLWLEIGKKYKMANLRDLTTGYRVHKKNTVSTKIMLALKNNIELVKGYQNDYPNYLFAISRRCFRYFIYRLYRIFI